MKKIIRIIVLSAIVVIIVGSLIGNLFQNTAKTSEISSDEFIVEPLPELKSGWKRVNIDGVGTIDLPPTMEVQEGEYKVITDNIKKEYGIDVANFVAQQKGLNKFEKEGFEMYARVMVETVLGSFDNLNFNISEYSQTDINELSEIFIQETQNISFNGEELKIIEWYPLKIERVNGMSCIHMSFKRQLGDKPFVLVHSYIFQNNDKMHRLTLSYRLSDANYWQTDYSTILKSFRITNF